MRHREHVPDQRAAELRPDLLRVRVGEEPVEEPRPAHVQQREQPGAHDREEGHRLGEPVDARPPLLVEQQQDRRDQRAGVADADPPDEVDDREAPGHRDVDAPDADADDQQVADPEHAGRSSSSPATPSDEPPGRRGWAVLHEPGDLSGHRRRGVLARQAPGPAASAAGGCRRHVRPLPACRGSGCGRPPGRSSAAACSARRAARSCAARSFQLLHLAGRVVQSPKTIARDGHACWQAVWTRPSGIGVAGPLGLDLGGADPLHAVGALLHHAPAADRDLRVAQRLERLGGEVGDRPGS